MSRFYSTPFRVYVFLAALALAGVLSGLKLPVSLFPNSSKPTIWVYIPFGNYTAEEFLHTYGERLEEQLRAISNGNIAVETLEADYRTDDAKYLVKFNWGVSSNDAKREVSTVVNSFSSLLPEEMRNGLSVDSWDQNSGFFALSFYSDKRSLTSVYDLLDPIITPRVAKIPDAGRAVLFNPASNEIRVELKPEAIASLQLFPRDIEQSILFALGGRSGGSIMMGNNRFSIEMPRYANHVSDLAHIPIPTPSGKSVHLSDVAYIDIAPKSMNLESFKTSGMPSIILFASPKPGGNVKKMSEDILQVVQDVMTTMPKDIQYKVLVDPSQFIKAAVNNVLHEVGVAALLAVIVLFIFIGSVRNVITAAIEIPLSMVLAFILMRLSGINMNLISLGGLALSAGMNVDASVVVMENIFRHFEMKPGPHTYAQRLKIVTEAVKEVQFPVIASTICSLVVFVPLIFTSDLSFAILGDLAFAVCFSHGFSAFVALLLVPTVRLQLMKNNEKPHHSPFEKWLKKLENGYANALESFILSPKTKILSYLTVTGVLVALGFLILPKLPREIVGKPDTDWIILGVNTHGNTLLKQMDSQVELVEHDLLNKFRKDISYTFVNINNPNNAHIMARLHDKSKMTELWKKIEKTYVNTPEIEYWVFPWNPSELPIPDPPDLKVSVRSGTIEDQALYTRQIEDILSEVKVFPKISTKPNADRESFVSLTPHVEQWVELKNNKIQIQPADLADILRVATEGKRVTYFPMERTLTDIVLHYPRNSINLIEEIGAFPLGIGNKIIPLRALADVQSKESPPSIYREDGREVYFVEARENVGEEFKAPASIAKAKKLIEDFVKAQPKTESPQPVVSFEDADKDLNNAIEQLTWAVVLSIGLVLLTLILQFGTLAEPLLVLVSIPLGFIGVILSLWIFKSTLSLNSILGVILLNGIAVANSIILVDFIKRLVDQGMEPIEAAVEAARKRLRPILITSLTTCLGMLPIALGSGEGGKILQPLGIAVSGGLWISMTLTLFSVPALQVSYLEWRRSFKSSRNRRAQGLELEPI